MITAESSATIRRPVADVFAFVTDAANDASWRSDVITAERTSPGPLVKGSRLRWILRFMGRREAIVEVDAYEAVRRVQFRVVGGTLPMRPTITYSLEPADGATRFTRKVEIEPTGAFKLLAPLMAGMASKQNAEHVAQLKEVLERDAGEPGAMRS